jgi:hypothetical protein
MSRKEYLRNYYLQNKELLKIKQKINYRKNRAKKLAYQKEYNILNKEKILEYWKSYYEFFKEEYSNYNKVYYRINKNKIKFNRNLVKTYNTLIYHNLSFDRQHKNIELSFD